MPNTSQRRRLVRTLVEEGRIATQQDLVAALAEHGHDVTQATASRDLTSVGATRGPDGYVLDDGRHRGASDLTRALDGFCQRITPSGNLVVLKTPPGAAHLLGAAIDAAGLKGIAGTVAGDDTVLVVAAEGHSGREVATTIERAGGL
jgi:transcriptional regulator of arginine metabolism